MLHSFIDSEHKLLKPLQDYTIASLVVLVVSLLYCQLPIKVDKCFEISALLLHGSLFLLLKDIYTEALPAHHQQKRTVSKRQQIRAQCASWQKMLEQWMPQRQDRHDIAVSF